GGGSRYAGTIFRFSPTGTFTPLFSFGGGSFGTFPYGGLVQVTNGPLAGNFYGTTFSGGAYGNGTIFRMAIAGSSGTVSFLYSFTGGADGAFPTAGLTLGSDGNFYGTAFAGGQSASGAVFKMTPAGVVTSLHQFTGGPDGGFPYAGLNFGSDGS